MKINSPFIIFLVVAVIATLTSFGLLCLIPEKLTLSRMLDTSAIFGIVIGLVWAMTITQMRKSDRFWARAQEVESRIQETETKSAMESILDYEFNELAEMAQGTIHYYELKRLHTIIDTKMKYLK